MYLPIHVFTIPSDTPCYIRLVTPRQETILVKSATLVFMLLFVEEDSLSIEDLAIILCVMH